MRRTAPTNDPITGTKISLKPDIDPPPKPWPFASAFAVLAVMGFISLQFILPATHVRDPRDPHRNWIPKDQFKRTATERHNTTGENENGSKKMESGFDDNATTAQELEGSLIFVVLEETDLRPLAVIVNSTVSNTREPEKLFFHVVVPSSLSDSDIYKFKAIFSNYRIDLIRNGLILEKMKHVITSKGTNRETFGALELLPFNLPKLFPSFQRFVVLDPDIVLQGDIEELLQLDLEGHAVGAVEDCSLIFETFFSFELLAAARLSQETRKPQMPAQTYEPKTCFLDKGALVVDQKAWNQKNITEATLWWIEMFHKTGKSLYRTGHPELPVQLALYQSYKKMNASWSIREPLAFEKARAAKLLHFDKKHKPWHNGKPTTFFKDVASLWWKYLSPEVNELLRPESVI